MAALCMLVLAGLLILYSTSAYNGQIKFQDPFYYLKKQLFATALGAAGMYAAARIDYHLWRHVAVLGYLAAVLLSIAVLFVGDEYNGSKRWLSLGPLSFQPSEFAKVAVILFLAHVITKNIQEMGKMRTLLKIMAMILPIVGLVGASNLSTAIIILGIAVVLVFVASPKYGQFVVMGLLGMGFMGVFLALEAIAWSGSLSGEIRKTMRKVTRRFRGFMPSVPGDCSAEDWEKAYRSWDSCRRPRMI